MDAGMLTRFLKSRHPGSPGQERELKSKTIAAGESDATERRAPDDTATQSCAVVDTGSQGMAENEGSAIAYPVLGEIHSPREHALALVAWLVEAGAQGRSVSVRDLQTLHMEMCVQLGWTRRKWPAIGRELKALGLATAIVAIEGERLTYYEIQPISEPAANVVQLKRDVG